MSILVSIFKELDRATGVIVRNAVKETIKTGRRILVKAHKRKGKTVKAHRRTVTKQGRFTERMQTGGSKRARKKAQSHGAKTSSNR